MAENSISMQLIENFCQENKKAYGKLTESYESAIWNLKKEVAFLRELATYK